MICLGNPTDVQLVKFCIKWSKRRKVPISRRIATHGDLIYKELSKGRKERNLSLAKGDGYVAITKKWLFCLL